MIEINWDGHEVFVDTVVGKLYVKDKWNLRNWIKVRIGSQVLYEVGFAASNGYAKFKGKYRSHWVWFAHYGEWPKTGRKHNNMVIDHIDRNQHNDAITNLRYVSWVENLQNQKNKGRKIISIRKCS